jgi:hypothetical protein
MRGIPFGRSLKRFGMKQSWPTKNGVNQMGNQTDYFNKIGYKHVYDIGDRIFGYYKKIPFVGTVGNDRKINDVDGPEVTVHLDLPMQVDGKVVLFIVVKHTDIKFRLKES